MITFFELTFIFALDSHMVIECALASESRVRVSFGVVQVLLDKELRVTIGLPKSLNPFSAPSALSAMTCSLKTTNACPRILNDGFRCISVTSPYCENRWNKDTFSSKQGQGARVTFRLDLLVEFAAVEGRSRLGGLVHSVLERHYYKLGT